MNRGALLPHCFGTYSSSRGMHCFLMNGKDQPICDPIEKHGMEMYPMLKRFLVWFGIVTILHDPTLGSCPSDERGYRT